MDADKIKKLIDDHPRIFSHLQEISCSNGWYNLLYSLCNTIEFHLKDLPEEERNQMYAVQIKSKFGGLRFYCNKTTPFMDGAITVAEELTNHVCEICGSFGGHKNVNGWYATLCDTHFLQELNRKF